LTHIYIYIKLKSSPSPLSKKQDFISSSMTASVEIPLESPTMTFKVCAILATALGLLAYATPAVAQTPHNPTVVRGNLRMVASMAGLLGEPSSDPTIFYVLTPAGAEDRPENNYLLGSVSIDLANQKDVLAKFYHQGVCDFHIMREKPTSKWYAVTNITACAPAK
jgi:hypothetical protein